MKTDRCPRFGALAGASALLLSFVGASALQAAPTVFRLTPPSALFTYGDATPPIIARFLKGQRFDLQATIVPESGQTITSVEFYVNNVLVPGGVSTTPSTATGAGVAPVGSTVATLRAYSNNTAGIHVLKVRAVQSDASVVEASGNFEVKAVEQLGRKAKNLIIMIGDGMGIAHRTAARIVQNGITQGKGIAPLAMDTFPNVALVTTASLNSIITDSSPGAACYATGNKSNNNQQGVFPDDTTANFDNPRVELIGEYLARTTGKALGIVTTSDVFDATPGSFGSHTQARSAGTGIVDQFLDEGVPKANLRVLLGGGRKWFLPANVPGNGSARSNGTDYTLPADLVSGWSVAPGALDPNRDLLADFQAAGFAYAPTKASLTSLPPTTDKLIGLFALSNMNVALDKLNGRRGASTVVNDYGFPDQPLLEEMTAKAIEVLNRNPNGFVLMVEAASIDKQAHNMDTERWILDTIEFDKSIQVAKTFAETTDTLVYVTADHECAGAGIIGASLVTHAGLQTRAASGLGAAQLRAGVVGTYEGAGFPLYTLAADGYPQSTDINNRMLIGYAANADRYEDWITNPLPLRDSQQPFNNVAPLNTYPGGPLNRDVTGAFLVTGQIPDAVAAHTGSDIPLSAFGRGATLFRGVVDNTDVFFLSMQAVLGGAKP